MPITRENIEEYKASLGPLEQYIPGLDKLISGNEHHGRCPFCNELGDPSSPCFWVWAETQRYICRKPGCEAKGDIINYIEHTTGKDLAEQLADAGFLDSEMEDQRQTTKTGTKAGTKATLKEHMDNQNDGMTGADSTDTSSSDTSSSDTSSSDTSSSDTSSSDTSSSDTSSSDTSSSDTSSSDDKPAQVRLTEDQKKMKFLWSRCKQSTTPYIDYLKNGRGIDLGTKTSPAILWNSYTRKGSNEKTEMVVMPLTRPGDQQISSKVVPQSILRIWLDREGDKLSKKKGESSPKAMNWVPKAQSGRAVWFFPDMCRKVVGHGEGQETMLAVHVATGLNVAASLTTAGINNVAFFPEQEKVYFFIDQDAPKWNEKTGKQVGCGGQVHGIKAALRAAKKGLDAWVVTPTDMTFSSEYEQIKKVDFNDLLVDDPSGEYIRARVEAAIKPEKINWESPPDKKVVDSIEEVYPDGTLEQLEELNKTYSACLVSGKFRIAREYLDPTMNFHSVDFLEIGSFINFMRPHKTMVFSGKKGNTKVEPLANVWLEWAGRNSYSSVVFDPSEKVQKAYNLFKGFPIKPIKKEGGWDKFKAHMYHALCGGRAEYYEYLMGWMARPIQNPGGTRPGVALVFRGGKGVGKGTFAYGYGRLFGESFIHLSSAKGLTGDFNMHLSKGLLVFADEAVWGGDKSSEGRLKAIITEPLMEFEPKGIDKQFLKNHVNLVMASNEDWVCPATEDERRFFVLNVCRLANMGREYFEDIRKELDDGGYEAMMYDLLHHDYSEVDLRSAPKTEGLIDQVAESLGLELEFWFDVLERGYLLSEHNGAPRRSDYGNEQDYWPSVVWRYELKGEFQERFMAKKKQVYPVTNKAFWQKTKKFWQNPKFSRPRNALGKQDQAVNIPDLVQMREMFTSFTGIKFDEEVEDALSKIPF